MLLSGGNSRPLLCHCSVTNCDAQFVRGNSHSPDLRSHFRFEVKTTSHHSEFLQKAIADINSKAIAEGGEIANKVEAIAKEISKALEEDSEFFKEAREGSK